ncbi:MAG: hypothetical protein RSE12_17045 [Fuscovulum sp.]|nr:MAG: hypothetical protein RSE12_17045 [Fuscovulum sp.]
MICPERNLWQAALLLALYDATRPITSAEARRNKSDAHAWIKSGRKDFRRVCEWAGFDPDMVRDAYLSGLVRVENVLTQKQISRMVA